MVMMKMWNHFFPNEELPADDGTSETVIIIITLCAGTGNKNSKKKPGFSLPPNWDFFRLKCSYLSIISFLPTDKGTLRPVFKSITERRRRRRRRRGRRRRREEGMEIARWLTAKFHHIWEGGGSKRSWRLFFVGHWSYDAWNKKRPTSLLLPTKVPLNTRTVRKSSSAL